MNLSAQQRPIDELEDAHEHAETLLTKYADMLPDQLASLLSTLRGDLTVIIEDHYGIKPDDDDWAEASDASEPA